jgi:very-short-patch-repair endonuclease
LILIDLHPQALSEPGLSGYESPIEGKLLEALVGHGFFAGHGEIVPRWLQERGYVAPEHIMAMLLPQALLLDYRVDFLIVARGYRCSLDATVVECDGHEFHERTKAQAARDRRRDRRLTAAGYRVMRFTGAKIHWAAEGCADEVWQCIATACGWRNEGDLRP